MTPASDDMQAVALRAIGLFSQVQDSIDSAARMLCRHRMNRAGSVISEFAVSRINDEDRVKLLMAVAEELNSDALLGNFKAVFMRAKRLRDALAHSSAFHTRNGPDRLDIGRGGLVLPRNGGRVVDHVTRSELNDVLRDCSWLSAQVTYITAGSPSPILTIRMGSQVATVFKPTASPEDWDGVVTAFPVGNE